LIGNVGNDPEIRTTNNGGRVASFSLATTRQWNGAGGDRQEKTDWHKCIVWNNQRGTGLADVVEKYVKKGEKLYVEGRIEYRQFQDKDGQTRYITEIIVRELILLGTRRDAGDLDAGGGSPAARRRPTSNAAVGRGNVVGGPVGESASGTEDFEDFPGALAEEDDDLPF
jgi:single-strand DNA-binding protein